MTEMYRFWWLCAQIWHFRVPQILHRFYIPRPPQWLPNPSSLSPPWKSEFSPCFRRPFKHSSGGLNSSRKQRRIMDWISWGSGRMAFCREWPDWPSHQSLHRFHDLNRCNREPHRRTRCSVGYREGEDVAFMSEFSPNFGLCVSVSILVLPGSMEICSLSHDSIKVHDTWHLSPLDAFHQNWTSDEFRCFVDWDRRAFDDVRCHSEPKEYEESKRAEELWRMVSLVRGEVLGWRIEDTSGRI